MSATSCCRAWRMWPTCVRRTRMRASCDRDGGGEEVRRRDRGRHRTGACQGHHAVGRRADASQGHQVGAAIRDRDRARVLAGRGGVRRGGEDARAGRGRVRAGRGDLRGASRRHRCRDRARCRHAGDPSGAGRQSHLRAQARGGRSGQGLRRRGRGDRGDVPVRPPYRRVQRAARDHRRLESGRAAPDRVSRDAGAAHDAEPVRQASRPGRAAGARRHQGCRRLVRHQGAHLCRRDGDGGALEAAQAPGEVRRRPAGKLRHRHSRARSSREGQDRRQTRRHDHRVGNRRSHRHRAVFGLSAHQRHRGQPGREPDRRAVHLPELSRPRPRRVPEQERDVPVPRGRPSDRDRRDRRAGRSRRDEDRHGPAGDPAAQSHSRRRLSGLRAVRHQVREALASRDARAYRLADELRRACAPSRRACASRASIAASALRRSSR